METILTQCPNIVGYILEMEVRIFAFNSTGVEDIGKLRRIRNAEREISYNKGHVRFFDTVDRIAGRGAESRKLRCFMDDFHCFRR